MYRPQQSLSRPHKENQKRFYTKYHGRLKETHQIAPQQSLSRPHEENQKGFIINIMADLKKPHQIVHRKKSIKAIRSNM